MIASTSVRIHQGAKIPSEKSRLLREEGCRAFLTMICVLYHFLELYRNNILNVIILVVCGHDVSAPIGGCHAAIRRTHRQQVHMFHVPQAHDNDTQLIKTLGGAYSGI